MPLKQLNIVVDEMQEIPEFQKEILRSRIKNSEKNPETYLIGKLLKTTFNLIDGI